MLDDAAVFEDDDQVGVADRREPVRDDESRATGEQSIHALLDLALGADVDRRGCFVEDQDARVGEQRAGECEQLALAERQPEAALAELRVVAVLELLDPLVGTDGAGCFLDVAAAGVGPAECDVLGHAAREQEAFLWHDPELAAQRLLRDIAEVVAVDRDPALAWVVEAGEQLRDGRLSCTRLTDECHRRPSGNLEIDVVQYLGQVAVAEADMVETDMTGRARQVDRSRRVHDIRLGFEHLHDLVQRGDGRKEHVVELRELLHRVEEVREVEREREQRPDRHLVVDQQVAAVPQHDRGRERREEIDRREVDPVEDDGLVVRLAVTVVDTTETLLVHGLACERLHDAHASDVLGERRGDEADPLSDAPVRTVRTDAEPGGRERDKRHDRQRREREPPVEDQQDDRGPDEQKRVLDEARDAVGDELVERFDVVRDPADDRAGAVALEKAEREPLQVREQPVAQVGEHAFSDPAGLIGLRRREEQRGDTRGEERANDQGQLMKVTAADASVDGELREERRRQPYHREREQRGDC